MPVQYDIRRAPAQQVRVTTSAPKPEVRQGFIVDRKPITPAAPQEEAPQTSVAPSWNKYVPLAVGAYVLFLLLRRK